MQATTDSLKTLQAPSVGSSDLLGTGHILMALWEAYERDGPGCAMYLYKADAETCDAFENGCDRVTLSHVRVSPKELKTLYARQPVFA